MSIIYIAITFGTGIGPFVGGSIVQHTSWRWVFLLNLPAGGFALLLVVLFLRVNHDKESTVVEKLKRIDYIGNSTFPKPRSTVPA
jgi:MFS family permease